MTYYTVGDLITWQPSGGGKPKTVRVTEKSANVKNGQPGFVGRLEPAHPELPDWAQEVWGYDAQVVALARPMYRFRLTIAPGEPPKEWARELADQAAADDYAKAVTRASPPGARCEVLP